MGAIDDLLYTGLTYAHNFEQQISQQAAKMAQASTNADLKEAFVKSQSKGQEYGIRIEQTFAELGKQVKSNDNPIAKAMIEEVENIIANTDALPVRDAALIVAANQQLYRVAVYGSLKSYAKLITKADALEELAQTSKRAREAMKS